MHVAGLRGETAEPRSIIRTPLILFSSYYKTSKCSVNVTASSGGIQASWGLVTRA